MPSRPHVTALHAQSYMPRLHPYINNLFELMYAVDPAARWSSHAHSRAAATQRATQRGP